MNLTKAVSDDITPAFANILIVERAFALRSGKKFVLKTINRIVAIVDFNQGCRTST